MQKQLTNVNHFALIFSDQTFGAGSQADTSHFSLAIDGHGQHCILSPFPHSISISLRAIPIGQAVPQLGTKATPGTVKVIWPDLGQI